MRLASLIFMVVLTMWAEGASGAESIRYITTPLGGGQPSADFTFQNHNTTTPFTREGESISVGRSLGSSVFAYRHGIDLTSVAVRVTGGGGLRVREMRRVNGFQSGVFMDTGVPGVAAKTGAIGYSVLPSRSLPIGSKRTVELRYPTGDRNTFVVVVTCRPHASEAAAKLKRGTVTGGRLTAGTSTTLRLEADMPPRCGGQPLRVEVPTCFMIVNPANGTTSRFLNLNLDARASQVQSFRINANGTCSQPNQARAVSASLSGVSLPNGPTLTWVSSTGPPSIRKPRSTPGGSKRR